MKRGRGYAVARQLVVTIEEKRIAEWPEQELEEQITKGLNS